MDALVEFVGRWTWLFFLLIIVSSCSVLVGFVVSEGTKHWIISKWKASRRRPEVRKRLRKLRRARKLRKKQEEQIKKDHHWYRLWRLRQQKRG